MTVFHTANARIAALVADPLIADAVRLSPNSDARSMSEAPAAATVLPMAVRSTPLQKTPRPKTALHNDFHQSTHG
jgi:hypothetical protein